MKTLTLYDILNRTNFNGGSLHLKYYLLRKKRIGLLFFKETLCTLPFEQPFEIYFYATKGTIEYQHAFPVPINDYKPWMKKKNIHDLLPFFQSYYETSYSPDDRYFQSLSHFKAEKFVWFYQNEV